MPPVSRTARGLALAGLFAALWWRAPAAPAQSFPMVPPDLPEVLAPNPPRPTAAPPGAPTPAASVLEDPGALPPGAAVAGETDGATPEAGDGDGEGAAPKEEGDGKDSSKPDPCAPWWKK